MDEFDESELRAAGRRWRESLTIQDGVLPARRRSRWSRHGRLLPALAVAASIVAVLVVSLGVYAAHRPVAPAATTGASPVSGAATGELTGVSCVSATACMAVGTYRSAADPGSNRLLAERWDGHVWLLAPFPAAVDSVRTVAVACASVHRCLAVGSTADTSGTHLVPFAYMWNGTSWLQSTLPASTAASSSLNSVDCITTALCYAAGFRAQAAGVASQPWVLRYASGNWTVRSTPVVNVYPVRDGLGVSGGQLLGINCSSAAYCAAVGFADSATGTRHPWSMSLSGGRWSPLRGPIPTLHGGAQLDSVSCPADAACVTTGVEAITTLQVDGNTYAATLRADGTWSDTPATDTNYASMLTGVSCSGSASCLAAGSSTDNKSVISPLAERDTNSGFVIAAGPFHNNGYYVAVSCWAADSCLAVGGQGTSGLRPVADRYLGGTWTDLHPALPN